MKVLSIMLLLFASVSCSEDQANPLNETGCFTAIPKGGTERVLVKCCTLKDYQAGSNTNIGGTASWSDYTDHRWASCSDCK